MAQLWTSDTRAYRILVSVVLLSGLVSLSDVPSVTPSVAFDHAEQSFLHGYLEDAQLEAEQGYRRFLYSSPLWARRFQLLEATAMAWRGLNEDVMKSLTDETIPWVDRGDKIQRLTLQAVALTHLHQLPEAEQTLGRLDELCASKSSVSCGAVMRAHGLLLLERGRLEQAKQAFLGSLDFARDCGDGLLEATAMQNLGFIASQQEKHDEALSWYRSAALRAKTLGAADLEQRVLGNEGWEQYALGNWEKALEDYQQAGKSAASLGDIGYQRRWLAAAADAYSDIGELDLAEKSDLKAMAVARTINEPQGIIDVSMDLAQIYVRKGRPDDADHYARLASSMARATQSPVDLLNSDLLLGEAATLHRDWPLAERMLSKVGSAADSQPSMKWEAAHSLGDLYEAEGNALLANKSYKAALGLVEENRAELKQEASQLPFLTNAARIYDDYIHFLVTQGRTDEALDAADWSRARTLQQGLGLISTGASLKPPPLRACAIARKTNSTLLFYWMGDRESYLWAVSPAKTTFVKLPAENEIAAKLERYRRTLLALRDPLRGNNGQGDKDGRDLYDMLIAPVSGVIARDRPVVLFTDGAMTKLNFETLLVANPTPHYWIEDAMVSSAPSIRLFATKAKSASNAGDKLLLLGDSVAADPALPHLPMAALEVQRVKANFHQSDEAVFAGAQATPLTYMANKPEQFSYIHFVAHGSASKTDPLESAVILSRDNAGEDSYKLYARDILQHPISARLVTISACNSSGSASFSGEGVVGLSWAFLRAGAHNTIAALWDVSDASTPELMDHLYAGLQKNEPPATALRDAKLSLLHSGGNFSRPFYWAPFQLYSGH